MLSYIWILSYIHNLWSSAYMICSLKVIDSVVWLMIPVHISPKPLCSDYTILYKGPLQWHIRGPKVAILFAGTILLDHTILFARFYGISYDIDLEGIKDTETYCEYMNNFLSWIPTENEDGSAIYRKLCISYFILDQPALVGYQTPIHPATANQPLTRLSQWIVKYAQTLGTDWLDTPASITPASIQSFYDLKAYNMDDYIQPPGGWKTFNEFFTHHLKPGK